MDYSANSDDLGCMKQPRNFTLLTPSLNQQAQVFAFSPFARWEATQGEKCNDRLG